MGLQKSGEGISVWMLEEEPGRVEGLWEPGGRLQSSWAWATRCQCAGELWPGNQRAGVSPSTIGLFTWILPSAHLACLEVSWQELVSATGRLASGFPLLYTSF